MSFAQRLAVHQFPGGDDFAVDIVGFCRCLFASTKICRAGHVLSDQRRFCHDGFGLIGSCG